MKIYISLPISNRDASEARQHADLIKASLSRAGHDVVNPFEIYAGKNPTYADYLCCDLRALADCEAIFLLQRLAIQPRLPHRAQLCGGVWVTDNDGRAMKQTNQDPRECMLFDNGKCFSPKTIQIIGRCATCPLIYDPTLPCPDFTHKTDKK